MPRTIKEGERLPDVELAYLKDGDIRTVKPDTLFAGLRAILIGFPGAFTPLCTGHHLPAFVAAWPDLKKVGYDLVAWVSPNDPWTQDAWARQLDPQNRLLRLSDGNLTFARAAGLTCRPAELFMGERCERFVIVLRDAVVERLSVESHYASFSCTRPEMILR